MVTTTLPLPSGAEAPSPLALQWGETWLYLRNGGGLSPAPPGAAEVPATTISDVTWAMPVGLNKGICVEGGEPGSGASGFDLVMNLSTAFSPGGGDDWTITVNLLDEDSIIAKEERVIASGTGGTYASQSEFHLNYTSSRTSCQILKGHVLKVQVVSSRTAFPTPGGTRGWHLIFWAEDAIAPTLSTENTAGPTDIFYPNDLDGSRSVIVKGVLNNAFASSLIVAVRIAVEGPGGGSIINATAAVQDDNFTYTWTYARGATGGPYTIRSEVEDRQGNIFEATATITMVAFGLKITALGQVNQTVNGYTVPGESALYDLTVHNIGSSPTTVLMVTENPAPSSWTVSFSSESFGLQPGGSNLTVFRATPNGLVQPGNSAQITVVAQARDDPATIKARGTMLTTTIVQEEAALGIDPAATDATIRLGGFVEYDFTLTNNGGLATDVTLTATDAPSGWTRSLGGTSVVADGAGWKVIGLGPGAKALLTLNVTAPADSTSTDEFVCTVTARAVGNASTQATFVGTTQLLLGIEMTQASPIGTPTVDPGRRVEFQVDVVNTDPLQDHTITQAGTNVILLASPGGEPIPGAGAPVIEVTVPQGTSCCDPHESITISVIIDMPAKAAPGQYTFQLSTIVDGSSSQVATLNLTVNIAVERRISIAALNLNNPLSIGTAPVTFDIEVSNLGNENSTVDLDYEVLGVRGNEVWTVKFLDQGGQELPNSQIRVTRYGKEIVTLQVEAPATTFHADERDVKISGATITGGASAELDPAAHFVVDLEPADRFVRLLSAQYIILFVLGFIAWGLITAGWGRTIWRRTHGGGEVAAEKAPRKAREVK